ncbi:MAG: hypothetical protein WBW12_07085, partial [Terriglobales bacterium]
MTNAVAIRVFPYHASPIALILTTASFYASGGAWAQFTTAFAGRLGKPTLIPDVIKTLTLRTPVVERNRAVGV